LRQNGHTLRIIPGDQNHHMAVWYPGFKLDTVNYIFSCCNLNFRVVPGVSHCMEQQNLLIISVGGLNSSRLISSYKVIWKPGWPVKCKQMRGGRCRIFLLFQWQESIPKNC
jgi:hypothetical protein